MSRRLLLPAALLGLLFALGPANGAVADTVSGGSVRLGLAPDLTATLRAAGVGMRAVGAARMQGQSLVLPVAGGELRNGEGRLSVRGGLRLAAGGRTASLADIAFNTNSGAMFAKVGQRRLRLAVARRPRVDRDGFGFEATLGKLVLTDNGARQLGQDLGLPGLFGASDVVGTAIAGIRFEQVTVTDGTAYLTLAEGFAAKLSALQVLGEPLGAGWYYSKSPLTVALTKLHGVAALDLASGEIESADGLRLVQGELRGGELQPVVGGPEVTLQGVSLDFAAGTAAAEIKAQPSGAGEATVFGSLQIPVFHKNAFTGQISIPNSPLTLSPYLAGMLNATFAEPRQRSPLFVAGELLGFAAFSAGTHGKAGLS